MDPKSTHRSRCRARPTEAQRRRRAVTREIPDCHECGEDLAGNVDTDWREVVDPHERAQREHPFNPEAECRSCGADVGAAYGTGVVLACFETVGEPTSREEYVETQLQDGIGPDEEFTVNAWCPECSWGVSITKTGAAHPVHLPCKSAAFDDVEDRVRRHCGEQEAFNTEDHHPIVFTEDGAKRFEPDVGGSGEFAR